MIAPIRLDHSPIEEPPSSPPHREYIRQQHQPQPQEQPSSLQLEPQPQPQQQRKR